MKVCNELIRHPRYHLWASRGLHILRPRVMDGKVKFYYFGSDGEMTVPNIDVQIDTGADFSYFSTGFTSNLFKKFSKTELPTITIEGTTFLAINLSSDSLAIEANIQVLIDGGERSSMDDYILMLGLSDFKLLSFNEIKFDWEKKTWQVMTT